MEDKMKSIKEWQKRKKTEVVGDYFRLGWTFDHWYEKLILVALGILGLWKIYSFF